jgi:hypothetical protein
MSDQVSEMICDGANGIADWLSQLRFCGRRGGVGEQHRVGRAGVA